MMVNGIMAYIFSEISIRQSSAAVQGREGSWALSLSCKTKPRSQKNSCPPFINPTATGLYWLHLMVINAAKWNLVFSEHSSRKFKVEDGFLISQKQGLARRFQLLLLGGAYAFVLGAINRVFKIWGHVQKFRNYSKCPMTWNKDGDGTNGSSIFVGSQRSWAKVNGLWLMKF